MKARAAVGAKRTQWLLIAGAVLAIHGALCWLLLLRGRISILPRSSDSLELIYLPAPPVPPPIVPNTEKSDGLRRKPKNSPQPAGPPIDAENEPSISLHPPIDWDAERDREAAQSATAPSAEFKDFGFPSSPFAPPKTPQFGWDYAPTHRMQPLPGGGVLINLNDNCVLVFTPLPFFFCRPGHKPANGDLFKHMSPPSELGAPITR